MRPPDMKNRRAADIFLALQEVASLTQEVRDIDGRERIGAFDDQQIAAAQPAQSFSRAQRRQRTAQSAQIKSR